MARGHFPLKGNMGLALLELVLKENQGNHTILVGPNPRKRRATWVFLKIGDPFLNVFEGKPEVPHFEKYPNSVLGLGGV